MDCKRFEPILTPYLVGDLSEQEAAACSEHLSRCAACREILEGYGRLIGSLTSEPMMQPSGSESAALARALADAGACHPAYRPTPTANANQLLGFLLASIAVFAVIATVLALHVLGVVDFRSAVGPAWIVSTWVIVVFVTSFLPIVVTSRRRPLNGLTFKR